MTYLDPTLIETLLQEGALRRGVTVVAYRALIQATADGSGASFEQALQLAAYNETLPPDERKAMIEQLAIIKQEAARYGVSVTTFAKIMLSDGDGAARLRD